MAIRADTIVLGAGMVGVSTALALQARGRDVVMLERLGRAGRETSYGNAGLIERASVSLYTFPHEPALLMKTVLGFAPQARIDWARLPAIAPWLWAYFRESAPERARAHAAAALPLIARCVSEHEALAQAAEAGALLRHKGWLKAYRSQKTLAAALEDARGLADYGLAVSALDAQALAARERDLAGFVGAIHFADPVSCIDPGGLVEAYAALFAARGGRMFTGDARGLEASGQGWRVGSDNGPIEAREAVVALGPWSDSLLRLLGCDAPLGFKRGYHMHYAPRPGASLSQPVLDADGGYLLAPMARGIRLTTGAEFSTRDAPPSPVMLDRVEPVARRTFPLGARIDAAPWMGARPCLPDLLPVIGPAPRHAGLWFNFGHQHHGFTLGPVTGRLLAEMMTGEAPFCDPAPFAPTRF
ncbi:MAG: FAD-binding oxidoreductase [Hyphomicrobiales bacterium]|nr:FAD-binding oxidoreductase [Hyphomicrobiales bacterium]